MSKANRIKYTRKVANVLLGLNKVIYKDRSLPHKAKLVRHPQRGLITIRRVTNWSGLRQAKKDAQQIVGNLNTRRMDHLHQPANV